MGFQENMVLNSIVIILFVTYHYVDKDLEKWKERVEKVIKYEAFYYSKICDPAQYFNNWIIQERQELGNPNENDKENNKENNEINNKYLQNTIEENNNNKEEHKDDNNNNQEEHKDDNREGENRNNTNDSKHNIDKTFKKKISIPLAPARSWWVKTKH